MTAEKIRISAATGLNVEKDLLVFPLEGELLCFFPPNYTRLDHLIDSSEGPDKVRVLGELCAIASTIPMLESESAVHVEGTIEPSMPAKIKQLPGFEFKDPSASDIDPALIAEGLIMEHSKEKASNWHYAAAHAAMRRRLLGENDTKRELPELTAKMSNDHLGRRNELAEKIRHQCRELAIDLGLADVAGTIEIDGPSQIKDPKKSEPLALKVLNEGLIKALKNLGAPKEKLAGLKELADQGHSLYANQVERPQEQQLQLDIRTGHERAGITYDVAFARMIGDAIRERELEKAKDLAAISVNQLKVEVLPWMRNQLDFSLVDDGQRVEVASETFPTGKIIATVPTELLLQQTRNKLAPIKAAERVLSSFRSAVGNEVILYLIGRSHQQWRNQEEHGADFGTIVIDGGYQKLAQLIGITSKDNTIIRDTLIFGQQFYQENQPDDTFGLWAFKHWAPTKGKQAVLRVALGPELRAGYAASAVGDDRNAIPIPEHKVPKSALSRQDRGKAFQLVYELLLHFHEHREYHLKHAAVPLDLQLWQQWAKTHNLSTKGLKRLIDQWQQGESFDAPAIIDCSDGHVSFAPRYEGTREWMFMSAKRTKAGQERRRRGKKK